MVLRKSQRPAATIWKKIGANNEWHSLIVEGCDKIGEPAQRFAVTALALTPTTTREGGKMMIAATHQINPTHKSASTIAVYAQLRRHEQEGTGQ